MRHARELVMILAIFSGINLINYMTTYRMDDKVSSLNLGSQELVVAKVSAQRGTNRPLMDMATPEESQKPLIIIVMTSSGRSGSTLMAKLLRTRGSSVVFFEPLFMTMNILKDPCHLNGTCVSRYLKSIGECTYTKDFENWLKNWRVFYEAFHPEVSYCMQYAGDIKKCMNIDVRGTCQNSRVRIIKLIRSRMAWIEDLLKDDSLNIKIIYLTRDPRATLASYIYMGWPNSASVQCGDMSQDLENFERFEGLYPNKVFQTQLETLSINPYGTIRNLFGFLYGKVELYEDAVEFIKKHMYGKTTVSSGVDIVANSSEEYQAWRWEISKELLNATESDPVCQSVLKKLGHVSFGSLQRAIDRNIALFESETINKI